MQLLLPSQIEPGDTVGIVSPSWGGAGIFPHQTARGVKQLRALGLNVRFGRHAQNSMGYISDTPENRVADIHDFFADPEVRLIVAAIGGDHACHLLPLLDFSLIKKNPTAFIGYSDNTVLNIAFWSQTGLVTFNGPTLLTDFGEPPEMLEYTRSWFQRALCEQGPIGRLFPARKWTEAKADWELPSNEARPRALVDSPGWTFLKRGVGEGRLLGGCLSSLQHLRGTRFWPDWTDSILFLETAGEHPSLETVDAILMDYENMGVLAKLRGLLVGRPMKYDEKEKAELRSVLLARTSHYKFPIVSDMDFGHTAPQFTLPIGCAARIDTEKQTVEIIESCTAHRPARGNAS